MKLQFLGAAGTVTGSKYLIEEKGQKILIDCGLFQGYKELRLRNWEPLPVDPKTVMALILTHAHLDHSGYIPILVKEGFKGPIYASQATCDLCKILLKDAGHLQEEDAKRANKYGYSKHKPALPLFTEEDALESFKYFRPVLWEKDHQLSENFTFNLKHSGHILGSSFVTLKTADLNVVFSGDVGRSSDWVMKPPVAIEGSDYLILESTYGLRLHSKTDVLERLAEIINSTTAKGGTVLIPSFAVGRAQTILYLIYKLKQQKRIDEKIPVYLDSPMAQDATDLLCQFMSEHQLPKEVCSNVCTSATYIQSKEDSIRINHHSFPSIIISASGMAEGGRILHHIDHYGPKPENTIVFTGFQAAGTRGDRMLRGEKEIKIHGKMIPIHARIENLDSLSSHADYEELLNWLKNFKKAPKEVFLTHGEPEASVSLKAKIEQQFGWKVTVPKYLESFDLS